MTLYIKVQDGMVEVRQNSGALISNMALDEACRRLQIENHDQVVRDNERLTAEIRTLRAALANAQANAGTVTNIPVTETVVQRYLIDSNYRNHMVAVTPTVIFNMFDMVIRSNKIGAVSEYRRQTGCDLITAKSFTEQMMAHLASCRNGYDMTTIEMEEIKAILNSTTNNARIYAVKRAREVTGMGLAHAVYFVDHIQDFIDQLRDAI